MSPCGLWIWQFLPFNNLKVLADVPGFESSSRGGLLKKGPVKTGDVTKPPHLRWLSAAELPASVLGAPLNMVFLGLDQLQHAYFAVDVSVKGATERAHGGEGLTEVLQQYQQQQQPSVLDGSLRATERFMDVRSTLAFVHNPVELSAVAMARSLMYFHGSAGFCARCGARTGFPPFFLSFFLSFLEIPSSIFELQLR